MVRAEGSCTVDLFYYQSASVPVTPIYSPMFSGWPLNCALACVIRDSDSFVVT